MTSVPTPNWALNEEHVIYRQSKEPMVLSEGTFARPLSIEYVPSHIKELKSHEHFNPETEVYVFTSIGIVIVPLRKLSKV